MKTKGWVAIFLMVTLCQCTSNDHISEQEECIERSRHALLRLANEPNFTDFRSTLTKAKAVLIFPDMVRAGFVVGMRRGEGVLMVRTGEGVWSYPAFYTLTGGNLGLQAGFQSAETVFLIMNDKGVDQILKNKVKLGADLSLSAGTMGAGIEASTTSSFNADIYAFSRTKGIFAGGALEGAWIQGNEVANTSYYGEGATPTAIVRDELFYNQHAATLRDALGQY